MLAYNRCRLEKQRNVRFYPTAAETLRHATFVGHVLEDVARTEVTTKREVVT
jgi:hypothetical protein